MARATRRCRSDSRWLTDSQAARKPLRAVVNEEHVNLVSLDEAVDDPIWPLDEFANLGSSKLRYDAAEFRELAEAFCR